VSKVEGENMVDLFNGDEIERRGGQEGLTPLAWVWSQYKGELPQGMQAVRADGQASVALAWVWSQYRGEFPQSAGERNAISKADARASTMSGKEPSLVWLGLAAAILVVGGLVWLFSGSPASPLQ
jgi:hypothetical protein